MSSGSGGGRTAGTSGLETRPGAAPRFSLADAAHYVESLFGPKASAAALPSERDQNFAVKTDRGERFVLKIARSGEQRAVLEFQNAALAHLRQRAITLQVPRVIASLRGEEISTIRDADGIEYYLRLVTWIEGELFVKAGPPQDAKLLASLGRAVAELDEALADFTHPMMSRGSRWDLRQIGHALTYRELLSRGERRIVDHFRPAWEGLEWPALRVSVIHGDANDYNVLVRHGWVVGLIDYGDIVRSPTVCDLAIALAYALLGTRDPLLAAAIVTAAYHERYPLQPAEIEALFPLVLVRLVMSVCYSAYDARAEPGNDYRQVTSPHAWELLGRLVEIPLERCQTVIRDACGGTSRLLAARRRFFGGSLSLSYDDPLHIVRGSMQYLFDQSGRRYLDAYNNVPHVGHCHPRVVAAGCRQMGRLNTNTRYLSELANRYAERLVATLPGALKVCFFVNSGSEANELALRLARAYTGRKDLIVLEDAYHGNTTTLVDISPYKHAGSAGDGAPSWVHVASLPNSYRGSFRGSDGEAGQKYAESVLRLIADLRAGGAGLAGFIAESWPSVGGQLELPPGYLPRVYEAVRAAGGVCIADEVQTGYGRLGSCFWGFEAYGVIPDIVVLGKPIGNGHPIGAVVTTHEIAAAFDNGMEFFSTFGGNTVSCAIGHAVLEVVLEEQLKAHAQEVGEYLIAGLRRLQEHIPLIGDVRGSGLFLGVELVRDRTALTPATESTARVINRLRSDAVLIGSEGAFHNVLKIRPPMPFNRQDADLLLQTLKGALELE
jgi:4-aminobutyrate aminotransferase-like enzyme/Ser/Thr protein kinase RdoA (MazF antagonist)